MLKYQILKTRYEFRKDGKTWTNEDIAQKIKSWNADLDSDIIKEFTLFTEAKEFFDKEKENLPYSDYFEGNVFNYVKAYSLELLEVTLSDDGEDELDYFTKDFYISPMSNTLTQKELFVVYDGNEVYFGDSNNYNCNRVVPNEDDIEEDTLDGYLKAIAKSHPEYSDFIETHFAELCEAYIKSEHDASMEAESVMLDRLEADMYAGGGYGEDGANQRAEHQISRLKTTLDYEREKNMDYKIETNYNANVLFETSVAVHGQSYLVIYGEHINGNFCCIPSHGWGCEMSAPNDVFYNSQNLVNCGAPDGIAQELAKAIKEISKDPALSHKSLASSLIDRALEEQLKASAVKITETEQKQNTISVLLVEPNKEPRMINIDDNLEAMQALVGGNIEAYYPFADDVTIVCNEEGKINHLPLNRAIYDESGKEIQEIIAGSFFICYTPPESENFLSLPSEFEKKYSEMFKCPERFRQTANGIQVEKVKPAPTAPELI